jgi:hypothetical protein
MRGAAARLHHLPVICMPVLAVVINTELAAPVLARNATSTTLSAFWNQSDALP